MKMTLALIVAIFFYSACSKLTAALPLVDNCKAECTGPVSIDWNACDYCKYACQDCFCPNDSPLLPVTNTTCYTSCVNLWYSTPLISPMLVKKAANTDNPEFGWNCNAPEGDSEKVCRFACECSSSGPDCIPKCQNAYAAYVYNAFCGLPKAPTLTLG